MTGYAREARQVLEKLVKDDPAHPEGFANLGILWEQGDRLPEAQVCFEKAIGLEPKSTRLRQFLGMVLFRQGKFDDAQRILDEAEQLAPADNSIRILRASLFMERKEYSKAEREYREAVRLAPDDPLACLVLGRFLGEIRGAWDEGIALIERAQRNEPLPVPERAFLGHAYLRVGKTPEALKLFEELSGEHPDDPLLRSTVEDLRKRLNVK